jgi:sugar phosphate permease
LQTVRSTQAAPQSPPPSLAERQLARLQLQVFALTWLSYASYYFTRKNLSVVKSRLYDTLHISTTALGTIEALYLASYALGQFVSGAVGDRIGARKLLSIGMIGSALTAFVFGASSAVLPFALAFVANGFLQSTGWSGNVKAMQPFFSSTSRGRVMGLWTTNYQVGGLLATALATFLLTNFGWRSAFFGPALWVVVVGVLIALFLVEKPEECGLPPVEPELTRLRPDQPVRTDDQPDEGPTLFELLRMKVLWTLGLAYFGLKLIRYSLLFWLPFYLKQHLHYSEAQAGYLSLPFEVGGIVGSVAVGWLSDRYFRHSRLKVTVPAMLLLGVALVSYQLLGGRGLVVNAALLAIVGFLLFGPDSLLSGTMSQDLGGRAATGRVAGIINGMGSVGAIFSPLIVAKVSERFGWSTLFFGFCAVTVVAAALLFLSAILVERHRNT